MKIKPSPKETSAAKSSPQSSKSRGTDDTPRHDNRSERTLARQPILEAASSGISSLYIETSLPTKTDKAGKPQLEHPDREHATEDHDRKKKERGSKEKDSERRSRSSHHEGQ